MALSVYHNEVAPGQHEYSPIFSLTNIANDQNQLAMQISNDVRRAVVYLRADRYCARLLRSMGL